jgi:hypothetical protein
VARSADMRVLMSVGVIAVALTGCATTQQEAARLQLNSARIRASEVPTRVTVAGQAVEVTRVALVRSPRGAAIVVRVHNPGRRAISDLPISVGVQTGRGRRRFLNARSPAEFSYFNAHLPAVPAQGTITWVYAAGRRLAGRARPFATVGATPALAAPVVARPPVITVGATPSGAPSELAVALRNHSTIPQYQLPIYAYAQRGGRFVAAGTVTVAHLGSQARKSARLALLGDPANARLQVEALPTIVR